MFYYYILFYSIYIYILSLVFINGNELNNKCERRIFVYLDHLARIDFTDEQVLYGCFLNKNLFYLSAEMITHLVHANFGVHPNGKVSLIKGQRLKEIMEVASRHSNLAIILGILARSQVEDQILRQIMADNNQREKLINDIAKILQENEFSGVDISWTTFYNASHAILYEQFFCQLRNKLDENGLQLALTSFSVPHNIYELGDIFSRMASCSNFINVRAFDYYYGYGIKKRIWDMLLTGPTSPLFDNREMTHLSNMTILQTYNNLACYLKNFQKVNIIITPLAHVWENVSNPLWGTDEMWRVTHGGYSWENWHNLKGLYGYDMGNIKFHEPTKTSYIFDQKKRRLISFEDTRSIMIKLQFGERYGINGFGLEHMALDYNNTLLSSLVTYQKMCKQNSSYFFCGSKAINDSFIYNVKTVPIISSSNYLNSISTTTILYIILSSIILIIVMIGFIKLLLLAKSTARFYSQQFNSPLLSANKDESVTLIQKIAKGRFGSVYMCEWEDEKVAVKVMDHENEWTRRQMGREAAILADLYHPNICDFHGLIELNGTIFGLEGTRLALVMEFAPFGNLLEFLHARSPNCASLHPLLPSELIRISLMLARALQYLLTKNILHRDVAARNCIVYWEHSEKRPQAYQNNFTVKLSDFGMSRNVNEYAMAYYMRQFACTCFCFFDKKCDNIELHPPLLMAQSVPIRWTAPEAIKQKKYTFASDIWSYGIVLYEIFTYGKIPFWNVEEENLVKTITKGGHPEISTNMPIDIKAIYESCLELDPNKRNYINDICTKLEFLSAIKYV